MGRHRRCGHSSQPGRPGPTSPISRFPPRAEGAYAVARDLGLSYASLRQRLARAPGPRRPRRNAAAKGFVEIGGGELIVTVATGGSVVELTRRDGAKLVARLSGAAAALDVVALSEAFFGRRR